MQKPRDWRRTAAESERSVCQAMNTNEIQSAPAVPASPRDRLPARPVQAAGARARAIRGLNDEQLPRPLSAAEAAFRDQRSAPSPWRVVTVQAEAGAVISLLVGLVYGWPALWSAVFGAATAIVPGALMARGATRHGGQPVAADHRAGPAGLGIGKDCLLGGDAGAAARVLQPVVWPALLVALAGCLTVYWVALAWRAR